MIESPKNNNFHFDINPSPQHIEELINKRLVTVTFKPFLLPNGKTGTLWKNFDSNLQDSIQRFDIDIEKRQPYDEQKFTLFHELMHIYLEYSGGTHSNSEDLVNEFATKFINAYPQETETIFNEIRIQSLESAT